MKTTPLSHKQHDSMQRGDVQDSGGKTMSPPPFQLQASRSAPIQRARINLPNGEEIDTRHHSENELRDLHSQLTMLQEYATARLVKRALRRHDYDESGGEREYKRFLKRMKTGKDYREDDSNDLDNSKMVMKSSGMRLMRPGLDFAFKMKNKRKGKKMPITKLKGEMLELAFDELRKEEGEFNLNTNRFINNCPGLDHISPYGSKLFEQSKCFSSNDNEGILKQYSDVMDNRSEDLSLLFNNGSKEGKIGDKIRSMFEFKGFNKLSDENQDLLQNIHTPLNDNFTKEEEPDFDKKHELVEETSEKYYMQLPSDIWMEMLKSKTNKSEDELKLEPVGLRGEVNDKDHVELPDDYEENVPEMDEYFPQEFSIKQIKKFEGFLDDRGLGSTVSEIKSNKKKNKDPDFIDLE